MPVFQTRLHPALMKRFQTEGISQILQREPQFRDSDADSAVISIVDGHDNSDNPFKGAALDTTLLDCVPEKKAAYVTALNPSVMEIVFVVLRLKL